MDRFAFILHPLNSSDMQRKFKLFKYLSDDIIDKLIYQFPPLVASEITGIKSVANNREIIGNFIGCTLTSKQMLELPESVVLKRIIKAGKLAEKYGAKILGLGAMTSVVGDAGCTVAKNLKIPVTTGNSYTIATAVEGTEKAAGLLGKDIAKSEVVIVGANGAIGNVCAQMMARKGRYLTLVSRNIEKLENLAERILRESGVVANITDDSREALKNADIIITVTSATDFIINPNDLKPGALICDVARPRDVSKKVAEIRKDVLVIEGGLVEIPGDLNLNFDIGYPPGLAMACMAETMILTLERKWVNFTLGRDINITQVEEIQNLANKHGFKLAGFRSFEKIVTKEAIEGIKKFNIQSNMAVANI